MPLPTLRINKNWFTDTTVIEGNWDNIRNPLLAWANRINLAFNQISVDAFGSSYSINNSGIPSLGTSLQDQITSIISGGSSITGTTNATWTIHLGSAGRAILDTAGLSGARTFTFPDASTQVVGTDTVQTLTNKTLSGTVAGTPTFSGSVTFSSLSIFNGGFRGSGNFDMWLGGNIRGYSDAGTTQTFDLNATAGSITTFAGSGGFSAQNGGDFRTTSDAGVTQTFRVDGATGDIYSTPLTTGSILFAAASGLITQDNANLFWDNATNRLGIGTAAPGVPLDVASGSIRTNSQLISTVATGTAPLAVSSTTLVANLNADRLDSLSSADFVQISGAQTVTGSKTFSSAVLCTGSATTSPPDGSTAVYNRRACIWAHANVTSGLIVDPSDFNISSVTGAFGQYVVNFTQASTSGNGTIQVTPSAGSASTVLSAVVEARATGSCDVAILDDGGVPIASDFNVTRFGSVV